MIYSLLARHAELIENMVVGAAGKNARLFNSHFLDYFEVFLFSSDPRRDLRELESEILAGSDSRLVSVRICKELGLSDYSLRTGQFRHHFEDIDDLFGCVRLPRLLTVTECGVSYVYLLRHAERARSEVESHLRYLGVFKELTIKIRIRNVLHLIVVVFHLEKICPLVEPGPSLCAVFHFYFVSHFHVLSLRPFYVASTLQVIYACKMYTCILCYRSHAVNRFFLKISCFFSTCGN